MVHLNIFRNVAMNLVIGRSHRAIILFVCCVFTRGAVADAVPRSLGGTVAVMLSPRLLSNHVLKEKFGQGYYYVLIDTYALDTEDAWNRMRVMFASPVTEAAQEQRAVFIWPGKRMPVLSRGQIQQAYEHDGFYGDIRYAEVPIIGNSFGELVLNASRGVNAVGRVFWKERLFYYGPEAYVLQLTILQNHVHEIDWRRIKNNEKLHRRFLGTGTNYLKERLLRIKSRHANSFGGAGLAAVGALMEAMPTYLEYHKIGDSLLITNIMVSLDTRTLAFITSKELFSRTKAPPLSDKLNRPISPAHHDQKQIFSLTVDSVAASDPLSKNISLPPSIAQSL